MNAITAASATTELRRYEVVWHCLVLAGSRTNRVVVDGDYSTEADIPAMLAVAAWGTNKNADLVVIEGMTRLA